MKKIVYNYDDLKENDISEIVIRTKALVINNDDIYLGNEQDLFQFPGGHLEEKETFNECLKREVKEEIGIEVKDSEIEGPFMKITYLNKDWPTAGNNRKSEIYYYAILTNKKPDLSKTSYTENEKKNNFKIESFKLNEVIDAIYRNIPNNDMNKIVSPDMIAAIEEYLKRSEEL